MAAARHRGRWGVWVAVSLVLHGLALVLVPAPRRPAPLDETEQTRPQQETPPSDGGGDEQTRRESPRLRVVRLDPTRTPPRDLAAADPSRPERRPRPEPPRTEPDDPDPQPDVASEPEDRPEAPPPEPEPDPERFLHYVEVDPAEAAEPAPDATFIATVDTVADTFERPAVTDTRAGPTVEVPTSEVLGTPSPVRSPVVGKATPGEAETEPSPRPAEAQQVTVAGADPQPAVPPALAAPPPPAPGGARRSAPEVVVEDVVPATLGSSSAPTRAGGQAGLLVPVVLTPDRGSPELLGASQAASGSPARGRVAPDRRPAGLVLANVTEPLDPVEPHRAAAVGSAEPVDAAIADRRTEGDPDRTPDPDAAGDHAETTRSTSTSAARARVRPAGHPAPARPTEPYARSGSPQAAFDTPRSVDAVRVTARAHELAAWTRDVDAIVRARWLEARLPVEDIAFGVGGVVVVDFEVDRGGWVTDVRVAERSGFPQVDALALRAIPTRLPPPPAGPAPHRITFRYRNETPSPSR